MGKQILRNFSLCIFFIAFLSLSAKAQPQLALGEWNSYLPYRAAKYITQSETKIYFATDWSVLVRDKAEGYSERFSKVDGLAKAGVSIIKYHAAENTLIVVYDDSTIDLVQEEGIITLFDIPNFQGPIVDKVIFDIFIGPDNGVYLAANYGISKIDITVPEFEFTTFTGVNVNSVSTYNGYIYAGTDEGIYKIEESNTFPEDFAGWEYLGSESGLPDDYFAGPMTPYDDRLFLSANDSLFQFDGSSATYVYHEDTMTIDYLTSDHDRLIAGFYCTGCKGKTLYFNPDLSYDQAPGNCIDRPVYGLEDEAGTVWFADRFQKIRFHESGASSCESFIGLGPYSHRTKEIHVAGDDVWVASGGVKTNFNYLFQPDGIFWYIKGVWGEYNLYGNGELSEIYDFFTVTSHPETGVVYAGSFLDGLVEIDRDAGTLKVYNDSNSTLNNPPLDAARTRVSGLAYDSENNLWISNNAANRPISVWTAEGEWMSFAPLGCNVNQLTQVAIDENGYKWFVIVDDNDGILIFDEGELSDPTDDRCRVLRLSNSNLPTNRVNCLALDLDGDMWVGTEQGTIVFECGGNVFDESCQGSLRVVEQDDFGAFLLETENIRTIAVDGANRKWFGTDNGVFVQSSNGEEQIAFFDENNSPLFDNTVSDIAIHPNTGEVFIGTNKGLISIRGEATEGPQVNTLDVNVFPNPVRPDYEGPIAISGLARDANVKITDIHGTLMYETTALGGQAVWNGRDYTGRKASSGVYLVFATSTQSIENPDAVIAKIVFIN